MIEKHVEALLDYGENKGLFEKSDRVFMRNRLIEALKIDGYKICEAENEELTNALSAILDYAQEKELCGTTVIEQDLFDTKLMGLMTPRPSAVISKFWDEYKKAPDMATKYYYDFSRDTNYIRTDRIKKDIHFTTETEYGELEVSINMSKPEKDPKDIAAAKNAPMKGYPKCALCCENEGYSGSANQAARQNHRIIPLELGKEDWFLQYSPYVYYNEHSIVLDKNHAPMHITRKTFEQMFDFVNLFPHYFIGSNADLPIVGGSILSHNHFQGGNHIFPMMKAETKKEYAIKNYGDINVAFVNWPVTTLRLRGANREKMTELAVHILEKWRMYTDEEAGVFAETDNEPHSTVTPILRRDADEFVLDLALRNNLTSEDRPLGIFHPRPELHHIKKENIGLIEVMGLAILPSRLKRELEAVKELMLKNGDLRADESTAKHADWADQIRQKYSDINDDNIDEILNREVGLVYKQVIEDTAVFGHGEQSKKYMDKFIESL